ncbi:MAG TPA: hypothetical protein VFF98_09315 [Novosphingobium sp.]|nr:hypothetical protein [Novosphingobium sp.]
MRAAAPRWDRFAALPRGWARAVLAAAVLLLLASAIVPITVGHGEAASPPSVLKVDPKSAARARFDDLELYDHAIARIRAGENYYAFIVSEHRAAHYPVRPGLAVRLPTLAYFDAWAGAAGQLAAALALLVGVALAWWARLGAEPGAARYRLWAMAFLLVNASLGLNRYFFVLHELWAGMLIALSLGLHRVAGEGVKARWLGAWLAAALALALRELALPYVLLMAALAFWRGDRREGAAWVLLAGLFGVGLGWHLHLVAAHTSLADPVGPSWLALRGLGGWLSDVVLSSNLRFLPHWLAGPLAVLMVLGWAGWKSPLGTTAALFAAGYALAFMIAGRDDNYYWGAMVAPSLFAGLAFAPMALRGLWRAALA